MTEGAEFFPFLGPIKHLVIALQENMTRQIFALVIISFIPHSSLFVGLCVCTTTFCFSAAWNVAFAKAFSMVSQFRVRSTHSAHNSVEVVTMRTSLTNSSLYCVFIPYSSYTMRCHQPLRLSITE